MPSLTLQQALTLAMQQQQAGNLREAESILRQILNHDPNQPDALHLLGLIAHQAGQSSAAIDLIRRAIAIDPANAMYHGNLGLIHKSLGQIDQTIAAFSSSAALRPDLPEAHFNLGAVLEEAARWDEAIAAYQSAIDRRAGFADALNNLSHALLMRQRYDEAIAAARAALVARPGFYEAFSNLGHALLQKQDPAGALEAFQQAAALRPNDPQIHFDIGVACSELMRTDEAIASYHRALTLQPDHRAAAWNLSMALLLNGDYSAGWRAFEQRTRLGLDFPRRPLTQLMWDGSDPAGLRLLIHPEKGNGFGEVIQLARFIPPLAARGAKIILDSPPELVGLLRTLAGVEHLISFDDPLPEHDLHCPLMGLPARMSATLETVGVDVPYLSADPAKVEHWRQKLAGDPAGLKVGLVWAGRPLPPHRSIDPRLLSPLGRIPGVQFYSLQKPEADSPHSMQPLPFPATDCAPDLHDFTDTAALPMNLDLLITIDTAIAHLAGALARPTWLLLRHPPDWRWLLARDDSPWYPTMKLYRQTISQDWTDPVARVCADLQSVSALRCVHPLETKLPRGFSNHG